MKRLLLDSHIWFWYAIGSDRLSKKLREELDFSAGLCWYSPVSILELGTLAKKGRIRIDGDFRSWVERSLEVLALREAPINTEVALKARELDLPHDDPADRLLAATAMLYELRLVTVDHLLVEADWLPIYKMEASRIVFERMGTHSELFKR